MKYIFIGIVIIIILIILIINKNNSVENFEENEDETACKYVSSHGIKKLCNTVENCIYVKANELDKFTIPEYNFVLVTGNEDTTIPEDFKEKSNEILNSPNLIHWYSQNLNDLTHLKLSSIPIGLDYHTIGEGNPEMAWWGQQQTPKKQEELIFELNKVPYDQREIKLYINFANSIRGKYGEKDRKEALEQIPKHLQVVEENKVPRKESWKHMAQYAFVVSPLGNGLDCHRTWETLVLGCIPVVKTSSLDILYKDLPVLIVKNWYDINEELLKNTIGEFKNKTFNYDKLTLEYWKNIISNN